MKQFNNRLCQIAFGLFEKTWIFKKMLLNLSNPVAVNCLVDLDDPIYQSNRISNDHERSGVGVASLAIGTANINR